MRHSKRLNGFIQAVDGGCFTVKRHSSEGICSMLYAMLKAHGYEPTDVFMMTKPRERLVVMKPYKPLPSTLRNKLLYHTIVCGWDITIQPNP